ncbi:MAG TPA: polyphosphate kinase 1 [Candidatus Polarisedimenticolaceae bacterium]|nr:polyphosphate kinase 1 [Candidatus Polarisedimenticolaceae bacterium]
MNPESHAAEEREPVESVEVRLDDPALFINREASLLEFNRRVLAQATDPSVPLLERLRFLTIFSNNLDEFFEIRVAGLREQVKLNVASITADRHSPQETLRQVSAMAHELVREQYRVLQEELLPSLQGEAIWVVPRLDWDERIRRWVTDYFAREVLPVLTPIGLDPAHPFPAVLNKSLNFIVTLEGRDAFGRSSRAAIVQAPRVLPRLILLPDAVVGAGHHVVTLSRVIHENVGAMFPGMSVVACSPFRVTRDSDLWVDEEEVDDLLRALQGELRRRQFGDAVRLEINDACSEEQCRFLLQQFGLESADLYRVSGPVNVNRFGALYELADRPDLKYPPHTPALQSDLTPPKDIFDRVREGDVLLHHPFESFAPVTELMKEAAVDPAVLAIKVTLYRTGPASPLTDALVEAARNGKEAAAVIELRARFDEEANIGTATRLQQAGVKVVYGVVGYKAHAKMLLIVRREQGQLRRYVHLGTGNYHLSTTRQYTDFGLLTADAEIGEDVHNLFQQLTGLGRVGSPHRLIPSPFQFHARMLELIDTETELARAGRPARIRAKMNALIEPEIIRALYRASQAGVEIDLLVRGICCLRPGIPGVSDRIRVRSIVGRFLEHSRIFHFGADGEDVVYCASADWMPRNFFHRVEIAFPIDDPELKRRVLDEGIEIYLQDTAQAWELLPGGTYRRVEADGEEPFSAQTALLQRFAAK